VGGAVDGDGVAGVAADDFGGIVASPRSGFFIDRSPPGQT